MTLTNDYLRVACFSAIEYYDCVLGEWVRNDGKSQPSLTEMVNGFLEETKAQPVSMSAPQVVVISKSETEQVQRNTVSLIFRPNEIIKSGEDSFVEENKSQLEAAAQSAAEEAVKKVKDWAQFARK
jgi:hypothetical protein